MGRDVCVGGGRRGGGLQFGREAPTQTAKKVLTVLGLLSSDQFESLIASSESVLYSRVALRNKSTEKMLWVVDASYQTLVIGA